MTRTERISFTRLRYPIIFQLRLMKRFCFCLSMSFSTSLRWTDTRSSSTWITSSAGRSFESSVRTSTGMKKYAATLTQSL